MIAGIICIAAGFGMIGFSIWTVWNSLNNTPKNLSGFYGDKYWLISMGGFVSSALLIASGIILLIN